MRQLYSLKRIFQREPNLENLCQQFIGTDVRNGFVKILDESEVKGTFGKGWYLNLRETKQTQNDHHLLADCPSNLCNCPLFEIMRLYDLNAAVWKQSLCYGCLRIGHAIKDRKVSGCSINGGTKKHNRLLLSENENDEGCHAAKEQWASNKRKSSMLVVSVEEKAKATVLKLPHQEQFGGEINSLKVKKVKNYSEKQQNYKIHTLPR